MGQLGGLWSKMPITGVTFAVGTLSMAGLPFLAGFWAKDEILVGVLQNRAAFSLVLLTLPVTAMYMTRLFVLTFLGQAKDSEAHEHAHESPAAMSALLGVLALLTLVTGFVTFDQVGRAMGFPGGIGEFIFLHEPEVFHFNIGVAAGSSALVALGIAGGWFAYVVRPEIPRVAAFVLPRAHALLVNKYYLDDLYQGVIDNVVLAFSRVLAWFDRTVVNDTAVNGPAQTTGFMGFLLKFQQTGRMPNYALAMVIGVVALVLVAFSLKT
jgi:NADH-quinone oxidoreductase subunit L